MIVVAVCGVGSTRSSQSTGGGPGIVSVQQVEAQTRGHRTVLLFTAQGYASCEADARALLSEAGGRSDVRLVGVDIDGGDAASSLAAYVRAMGLQSNAFARPGAGDRRARDRRLPGRRGVGWPSVKAGPRDRPRQASRAQLLCGACAPCSAEMPGFERAYQSSGDRLVFVGMDVGPFTGMGSHHDATRLLRQLGIRYPAAYAVDDAPLRTYSVQRCRPRSSSKRGAGSSIAPMARSPSRSWGRVQRLLGGSPPRSPSATPSALGWSRR